MLATYRKFCQHVIKITTTVRQFFFHGRPHAAARCRSGRAPLTAQSTTAVRRLWDYPAGHVTTSIRRGTPRVAWGIGASTGTIGEPRRTVCFQISVLKKSCMTYIYLHFICARHGLYENAPVSASPLAIFPFVDSNFVHD